MYLKSYKELIVWQKSIQLSKLVFILTSTFPQSELYGLISQIRRAVVAIASNIAEGSGRGGIKEYIQFCHIAYGSALELETQLIISKDLGFATSQDFDKVYELLQEILKMLKAMIFSMKKSSGSFKLKAES